MKISNEKPTFFKYLKDQLKKYNLFELYDNINELKKDNKINELNEENFLSELRKHNLLELYDSSIYKK